jgi:hypothetical protein
MKTMTQSPNRVLPRSNHSPCECNVTKGDRIEGVPDKVLRPARAEVNVDKIGAKMSYDQKGYKTVSAPKEKMGKKRDKNYDDDDDE